MKKFRVARSGPTIDGREITPEQIEQMAASYNPSLYGARIWIEHARSTLPDGVFPAMGDVVSLSVEKDGDALALVADINPTPGLVKLSADRQKVFWSIEMDPNFAKTGGAYLVGLSVTDSPASLGTQMLTFSLTAESAPESLKSHLFSIAIEGEPRADPEPEKGPSLLARVKELFAAKGKTDDARFAQTEAGVLEIAGEVAALRTAADTFAAKGDVAAVTEAVAKLSAVLDDVVAKLSKTPTGTTRAPTSGSAANLTDC